MYNFLNNTSQREKKNNILGVLEFFIIYFLIFGIMLNRHYSVDSYSYSLNSTTQYKGNLALGRIANYFVFGLFKNINIITFQQIFSFLLIVTLAISARMIYMLYQKNVDNAKCLPLLKLGVLIIYGNVFMVDYFNYIEMFFAWCCGIIFMTVAVIQVKQRMSALNVIIMLGCVVISVSFYQALIGFFVCLALIEVYLLNKGKFSSNALKNSIIVLLCGGAAGIINILALRILQETGQISATNRTERMGISIILSNIKIVFLNAWDLLIDRKGFLPNYLVLIVLLILYMIILKTLIQRKAQWTDYVYIILLIICSRITIYIPHLLSSTIWMAPRSVISYWTILIIPCAIITTIVEKDNLRTIATVFIAMVFLISTYNIQKICSNIISTNRIDEEIAYLIQSKIEKYEEDTGNQIENIVFKNDASPSWTYNSTKFVAFELCERVYVVPWGCVECINYFNNENYNSDFMSEDQYNKYFEKDNWDNLQLEEQIIFDGNTLFYAVY